MPHRLPPLLKQVFGYDGFRPYQADIIEATLAGRDTVAILPTGAGKSLCYQLPALVREGLTLVVSPLIALMKDQVDQLQAAGVAATFLNSSLERVEQQARLEGLAAGRFKLLYLAPERLLSAESLALLQRWRVSALAVDEAHCISAWGHDFRPEYRQLAAVRAQLGRVPVIALTATATPRVREDIVHQLRLHDPAVFVGSFNRPNLSYSVQPKDKAARQVAEFVAARREQSGIVYCLARSSADALAAALQAQGLPAVAYHAGLDAALRASRQDAFLRDEARTVCATIAFGMGIHKPDVRYVIHADLPKNLEGYYQETGRAGRDGLPADCLLLFAPGDVVKLGRFLDESSDEQARALARRQLQQMVAYAESTGCRRADLLRYFGEEWPEGNCGACDYCCQPREAYDATLEAQKFLSCILRIRQRSGFDVGLQHVADVLRGGDTEKIRRWGHDQLSTYGIGQDRPRAAWLGLGRDLVRLGYAAIDEGGFATAAVTPAGLELLRLRQPLTLQRPTAPAPASANGTPATRRAGALECDEALFAALRALRKELADARGVPPYVVFSDVALRHMARQYPSTPAEFLAVPGVGERKLTDFGAAFLAAIAAWLGEHSRLEFAAEPEPEVRPARRPKVAAGATVQETLRLWREGMDIASIAAARGLAVSTIETHLAAAAATGAALDPRAFYSEADAVQMAAAIAAHPGAALAPAFAALEGRFSYGTLRIFLALQGARTEAAGAETDAAGAGPDAAGAGPDVAGAGQ